MDINNDDTRANGRPFTTKDNDNDKYSGNMAVHRKSAWWFNSANYYSDMNAAYNGNAGRMYWAAWSGSISKSIMMIKRIY